MLCELCDSIAHGWCSSMQAAALGAAVLTTPVQDQPPAAQPAAPAYIIGNVTIIDVENGATQPGRWVRLENGSIKAVHAARPERLDGATLIDATDHYLIPGLMDSHVHYSASPETFGPLLVAHGVTCVRDLGAPTQAILEMRRTSRQTDIFAPDIICTGAIIDGDPPVWPFSEPVDTEEEARAAVNKLHDAGVDQIKVYSLLKRDVYLAAVDEARKLGLKAVGHVPDSVSFDDVIQARQSSLEHMMGLEKLLLQLTNDSIREDDTQHPWHAFRGFGKYDQADKAQLHANLLRLKEADIAVCPTVAVMAGIARLTDDQGQSDPRLADVPPHLVSFWNNPQMQGFATQMAAVVPIWIKLIGDLHKAGVTLLVGTDLANAYVFAGSSVHEEMQFFADAGLPAEVVLRSATITPAKFCGVDDKQGSIAPGKTASLVLLRANPLDDIQNVAEIEAVFLRGRYYDRAALDAELKKVRAIVESAKPIEQKVVLKLPGETVYRGRYAMRFQTFDAGVEDFLITKSDQGYHLQAHVQPRGGPQGPSLVTVHANAAGQIAKAEYTPLTKGAQTFTYTINAGSIEAAAPAKDAAPQVKRYEVGANGVFGSPTTSGDFFLSRVWDLKVGESREMVSLSFGYPSWEIVTMPMKVTRLPDELVTLPDGTQATAQLHESALTTDFGAMTLRTWSLPSGLTVRSTGKFAFGEFETSLQSLHTD